MSAHWFINASAVTAMAKPRTIHDFYGFPQALFGVEYPAPRAPDLAAEIADVVKPTWISADLDSWGSITARGPCSSTCSPRPTCPWCSWRSTRDDRLPEHFALGAATGAPCAVVTC